MAENIINQRNNRNALIIYGSETGNSEDVAEQIKCLTERLYFDVRICEMNEINVHELAGYSIVILTVSTTGQGEFPTNARSFWKKLLKRRLAPGCLSHVYFTTFGLGDSSYPKFNVSARKLHKRLLQLGANEIHPSGEADNQHPEGIDGTYLPWSDDLRKLLIASYPLPEGLTPIPPETFVPPKYYLEIDREFHSSKFLTQTIRADSHGQTCSHIHPETEVNPFSSNPKSPMEPGIESSLLVEQDSIPPCICDQLKEEHSPSDLSKETSFPPREEHIPLPHGYTAILEGNYRVTPDDHFQDVRELDFLVQKGPQYEPGDAIVIYPKNFPEDVNTLIDLMDWKEVADKPLKFAPDHPDYYRDDWLMPVIAHLRPIPHSTLRQLLTHNLDITAIPRRRFFEVVSQYTSNSVHRDRLLELANPVFTDEFFDYTSRPRRSILEVLQDFPSVKLPWRYATTIFPIIRGRTYSITTGGADKLDHTQGVELTSVSILVAIVKYRTVLKKVRQGLCSRYLASLKRKTQIRIEFKKSDSFYKLARESPQLPLILVAPGTGIAPCRSLIFEREDLEFQNQKKGSDKTIGHHFLFFGCRNRKADYFFEDDWSTEKPKVEVFPAFSRDQAQKVYVQDIIRREADLITTLILRERAIIYVCGSSGNMPKSVKEAFIYALMNCESGSLPGMPLNRESAVQELEWMEKDGRYIQETW